MRCVYLLWFQHESPPKHTAPPRCFMVQNGRTMTPLSQGTSSLRMMGEPLKGSPHCTLYHPADLSPLPPALPSKPCGGHGLHLPAPPPFHLCISLLQVCLPFLLFLPRSLCLCLGIYFSIPLGLLLPPSLNLLISLSPISTDLPFCLCVLHSFPISLSLPLSVPTLTQLYLLRFPSTFSPQFCPLPCLSPLPAPHPWTPPHNFHRPLRHSRRGKWGDGRWRGREGKSQWWGEEGQPNRLGSLATCQSPAQGLMARPNISSSWPETENSVPVSPTPLSPSSPSTSCR